MKEANTTSSNSGMHIHRRLWSLALNVHGFFPTITLLSFAITWIIILQMYLLSNIISNAFESLHMSSPIWLILLALSILLRSILIWIRERFVQVKTVTIKSKLRRQSFNGILNLEYVSVKTKETGSVIANLTDGIEKLDDYFTKYIPSIIHIIVLPLVVIVFTLFHDWISGIILLFTAPLILFFMFLIGTHAKKLTEDQWGEMSALSSHFLDVLQGMKTLKTFVANHRESERVDQSSNNFRLITMNVLKVAFLSGMVLELAASISIALVAVQVGIRLIEGMMLYQAGLFVLLLAPEFYLPFRSLGANHHAGMEGSAAARELFSIIDCKKQPLNQNNSFGLDGDHLTISFQNVNFQYSDSSIPVLKNISCLLEKNSLVAIVGPTGVGKTTFANLLAGYIYPTSGEIEINGTSIQKQRTDLWQQSVAYVSQHPWFFNDSVINNLLLAKPDASHAEIESACHQSGALSFIENLPLGFHTMLSENASILSGGEKQRLAIARAILKNTPVIILDEPTSSLDPESEQLIANAIDYLKLDRLVLVIAHRLNTVKKATKILVFENGVIKETGSHNELINANGLYSEYLKMSGLISNQS